MNRQVFVLGILGFFNIAWEVSAEGGEKAWRAGIKPYADDCKHHMSEETAAIFEDDEEYDNEEVRDFLACLYNSISYMTDGKMNPSAIDSDIDYFFDDDQSTASSLHNIVAFCAKYEVDENDAPKDVAGKFTNCLNTHKKTDVED